MTKVTVPVLRCRIFLDPGWAVWKTLWAVGGESNWTVEVVSSRSLWPRPLGWSCCLTYISVLSRVAGQEDRDGGDSV